MTSNELVAGILEEYKDECTKAASDACEHCSELVLCDFHSLLSIISRRTELPSEGEAQHDD